MSTEPTLNFAQINALIDAAIGVSESFYRASIKDPYLRIKDGAPALVHDMIAKVREEKLVPDQQWCATEAVFDAALNVSETLTSTSVSDIAEYTRTELIASMADDYLFGVWGSDYCTTRDAIKRVGMIVCEMIDQDALGTERSEPDTQAYEYPLSLTEVLFA